MTRLQPLDLTDFRGGLVTRRSQFTLGDNESPDMLNVEIDPRAGIFTRKGWQRWNPADIVSDPDAVSWNPRNAKLHPLSTGSYDIYIAANGSLWVAGPDRTFVQLNDEAGTAPVSVAANPHLCDFAAWGDKMYFAPGYTITTPFRRDAGDANVTELVDASSNYNNDFTNPLFGAFPRADFVESHGPYMFAAGVYDESVHKPNRLRWSHPDQPEDWAELDFLDIERGGGKITGLLSFGSHLLIFKTDSVWALYGSELANWQLSQKSASIGVSTCTAFTRSENAVYFFSTSGRGGFYGYTGDEPVEISESIRSVAEGVSGTDDVWVSWLGRRLWSSLPYRPEGEVVTTTELDNSVTNTLYIFDPAIGDGAWVKHRAAKGAVGPFIERSTVETEFPMASLRGDSGMAGVVQMDFRDDAYDLLLADRIYTLIDGTDDAPLTDSLDGAEFLDVVTQTGNAFQTYYRTGWKHAGWPTVRKSWRRPKFVLRTPPKTVRIRANVYWDYDEATVRRNSVGEYGGGTDNILWTLTGAADPSGIDWGDGESTWGSESEGGQLERVTRGLGVNRAIQIEIMSDPSTAGSPWRIDMIHLPYILRRFTT